MVPPDSNRVSRVRLYSGAYLGSLSFRLRDYHPVSSNFPDGLTKTFYAFDRSYNPRTKVLVWAFPISLAATKGISVLIYFPLPTKMFQFGRSRFLILCVQIKIVRD